MPSRIESLEARKKVLLMEAFNQRNELSELYHRFKKPLEISNTVYEFSHLLQKNLWIIAAGAAVVGFFGLKTAKAAPRALTVWSGVRMLYGLWQKFSGPR